MRSIFNDCIRSEQRQMISAPRCRRTSYIARRQKKVSLQSPVDSLIMHWHCDIGFRIVDHNSIITVYLNTLKALARYDRNCRKIQLSLYTLQLPSQLQCFSQQFSTWAKFFATYFEKLLQFQLRCVGPSLWSSCFFWL